MSAPHIESDHPRDLDGKWKSKSNTDGDDLSIPASRYDDGQRVFWADPDDDTSSSWCVVKDASNAECVILEGPNGENFEAPDSELQLVSGLGASHPEDQDRALGEISRLIRGKVPGSKYVVLDTLNHATPEVMVVLNEQGEAVYASDGNIRRFALEVEGHAAKLAYGHRTATVEYDLEQAAGEPPGRLGHLSQWYHVVDLDKAAERGR